MRKFLLSSIAAATFAASMLLAPVVNAQVAPAPAQSASAGLLDYAPLVARVSPAVVSVNVVLSKAPADMPQIPGMPQMPSVPAEARGSGFIIDPSGIIVTNNHVIKGGKKITVVLSDGSQYPAEKLGADPVSDLAVLKIDAERLLPYARFGDSDAVLVGNPVVAIGNPFGLSDTVTTGIVSALNRHGVGGPDPYLQVSPAINEGNSGGPTFNLEGQVIGINTAILSPTGGSVGLGFDIPSNIAKVVVYQLWETGRMVHGRIGAMIQGLSPALAKRLGMDPHRLNGALVVEVSPNSPAAAAGLRPLDVVTAVDGQAVKTVDDMPWHFAEAPIGQRFDLALVRNGAKMHVTVAVGISPQKVAQKEAPAESAEVEAVSIGFGLKVTALPFAELRHLGIPGGLQVAAVADGSPASDANLQVGDIITMIDSQPASTSKSAAAELKLPAMKNVHLLQVNNGGSPGFGTFVGLEVPASVGSKTN